MASDKHFFSDGDIHLRVVEESDADFIAAIFNNPAYMESSNQRSPYPLSSIREYLITFDPDPLRSGEILFIAEDTKNSCPIGMVDLTSIDAYSGHAEIGIAISEQYRGKGMGTNILKLTARYAFVMLGLHSLMAQVRSDNNPALHLFSNAGYHKAGTLKGWNRYADRRADIIIFQLINTD